MRQTEFGTELFLSPHKEQIIRILPTLFNRVDEENRRGNKLNMGVGFARERILVALLMHVYGTGSVRFPCKISSEMDIIVNGNPVSIKTKTGPGNAGVKLVWTSDRVKMNEFHSSYIPASDLLYVNIIWGSNGCFYLIPLSAQEEIYNKLTPEGYMKLPKEGTNSRGVEIAHKAMQELQSHSATRFIKLQWRKNTSLLGEDWTPYSRWLKSWESTNE